MNTECEFNIGNYTPEQLTLRNGLPVVAIFENVMDKHPEYSVVFSDDSLHKTVYVDKKGSVGLDKSDFDVVLKVDKSSKELLCEAWDLFTHTKDSLGGLKLNIFRDGSGHISKGFNMGTGELFSFNSMSELIKGLKKL